MSTQDSNDLMDDLLELLSEGSGDEEGAVEVLFSSKLGKYISEKNITAGVDRIPNYVLIYHYKECFGGELSKIEFFRQFKKEFIQVRTGKQRSYMLDGSSFDLTREGLIMAEFYGKEKK